MVSVHNSGRGGPAQKRQLSWNKRVITVTGRGKKEVSCRHRHTKALEQMVVEDQPELHVPT